MGKVIKKLGWAGIALSVIISAFSQYLNIRDILALGWSSGIWLTIGLAVLFISVIALLLQIQREQEKMQMKIGGLALSKEEPLSKEPPHSATTDELTNTVLKNMTIRIADLAREDFVVTGRTFIDCVFYGPAIIGLLGNISMSDLIFETPSIEDLFIIVPPRLIIGAIGFKDCTFIRCQFRRIGIIGPPDLQEKIKAAFKGHINPSVSGKEGSQT